MSDFEEEEGFPRNDLSGSRKDQPKEKAEPEQKRTKKKKKFKNKKPASTEKKGRLIVRNVPFNATEMGLLDHFQKYGNVTEVKLLRKPDGKLVGCGFVNFENAKSAAKAIANISGKPFLGRPVIVDWAVPKTVYKNVVDHEFKVGDMKPKESDVDLPDSAFRAKKRTYHSEENYRRDDARLFITNLPFRISEDDLCEYFSAYGSVVDLFIIKKGGKQMGNGFVTFNSKDVAADVMKKLEGREFQGRPLYFQWAQPRSHQAHRPSENGDLKREFSEVKEEVFSDEETDSSKLKKQMKNFPSEVDTTLETTLDSSSIKSENESESETEDDSDSDNNDIPSRKVNGNVIKEEEDDDEEDDDDYDDDDDDDTTESPKMKKENKKQPKENPRESNDITEGLTVFLRNVPFDVNNDELKKFIVSRFGPVYYALVCIDAATEHSRGTAFVKFKNKDSVDAILNAGDDLVLHNEILEASMALSRDEIHSKQTVKNKAGVKNDNRNLYLSKEGLILAGSKAAKDVSLNDMNKRLSIESVRARLLKKNLLMFVSKTRLVIYNLPPNYTDVKLKKLFKQHSPKHAVITEARVMKDMKKFNDKGTFASREFGYISFSNHENALEALRTINNNPEIFSKTKRPIVLFSIENKQALATKEKRLEKSRKNNPMINEESLKKDKLGKKTKKEAKQSKDQDKSLEKPAKDKDYQGFVANIGKTVLKSGYKVWKQAQTHSKNVKKVKKLMRQKKQMAQLLEEKQMKKEVNNKTKKRKRSHEEMESKDDKKFERLVSEHRSDDTVEAKKPKKKWYS